MRKGVFDLNDLAEQLQQMQKIGGMSGVMGMLPGIGKVKKQIDAMGIDDSVFRRQTAIISSMTPKERRNPDLLKASRKKRIAAGSGTQVEEINRLLKMHRQMADMMKQMGRGKGMFARMGGMMGMPGAGGGMPAGGGLPAMDPGSWRSSPRPAAACRAACPACRRPRRGRSCRASAAGFPACPASARRNEGEMTAKDAVAGLAELRASIDNIDAALVHLLAERFKLTKQVGVYKAAHDLPPADPEREKMQLARLHELAKDAGSRSRLRREVLRIHHRRK